MSTHKRFLCAHVHVVSSLHVRCCHLNWKLVFHAHAYGMRRMHRNRIRAKTIKGKHNIWRTYCTECNWNAKLSYEHIITHSYNYCVIYLIIVCAHPFPSPMSTFVPNIYIRYSMWWKCLYEIIPCSIWSRPKSDSLRFQAETCIECSRMYGNPPRPKKIQIKNGFMAIDRCSTLPFTYTRNVSLDTFKSD